MTYCQWMLAFLKSTQLQPSGWNTIELFYLFLSPLHLLAPSYSEASTSCSSVHLFISYWAITVLEFMFIQIFLLLWYHHSKFHTGEMPITEFVFHQRHAFICILTHNSWHHMTLSLPQRWFTAMGNKYWCLKKNPKNQTKQKNPKKPPLSWLVKEVIPGPEIPLYHLAQKEPLCQGCDSGSR